MVCIGVDIDKPRLKLGVQDHLAGIEAIVSREHVADAAGQGKVQKPSVSHQLYRQKDRCNGAVGGSAKHRNQTNGSRNSRRNPQQRPHHAAKCGADEKGGYNLTALKACG